nr:MAG TPA: hypothetical protein [Caudoviricetes sp.]
MAQRVEIRGEEFPLCLTVEGLERVTELCGGLGNLKNYIFGKGSDAEPAEAGKAYANMVRVLGILIQEGEANRYMEERWGDPKAERRLVPGAEELRHLLTPGESIRYRADVIQAINDGLAQKIEAAPEKNAGGAGLG